MKKLIIVYVVTMCWLVRPIANVTNGYRQLRSVGKAMPERKPRTQTKLDGTRLVHCSC